MTLDVYNCVYLNSLNYCLTFICVPKPISHTKRDG